MTPRYFVGLLAIAPTFLFAQTPPNPGDVVRVGPGVTPPRVLRKVEPDYSQLAQAERVQGTVVLELVVDEKGRPTQISVISPLGFGLDEEAEKAVRRWEFAPATKDGQPVKILATIQVNFRFPGRWFDSKTEDQRTKFNSALRALNRPDNSPKVIEHTINVIKELSQQQFPAAMHLLGLWEMKGDPVTKDYAGGLALLEKAAKKNYGPALYEVGLRRINGQDLPKDEAKGIEEMRRAALVGSRQAQFYLGSKYERGDGVAPDIERAREFFRLCAAQGTALCQFRIGNLLLAAPDRSERDFVQAVAWLQLAWEQGDQGAKDLLALKAGTLTPEQQHWVASMKTQLVRK